MFSSATQPPPRHNFVVSTITFKGFKLHSSNLTHALRIQISRTSSIVDIVVSSKMAAGGHFVKKRKEKSFVSIWNGKKCDWKLFSDIQNGRRRPFCQKFQKIIKIRMDLKWPKMPLKVNFWHPIWPIDQKWPEMQSKVIFGHPKWPPKKNSVSIWNGQNSYRKLISDIQNGRSIWNGQKCN